MPTSEYGAWFLRMSEEYQTANNRQASTGPRQRAHANRIVPISRVTIPGTVLFHVSPGSCSVEVHLCETACQRSFVQLQVKQRHKRAYEILPLCYCLVGFPSVINWVHMLCS